MADGVDLYLAYKIVRKLTLPFDQWKAFQLGVIDKDGTILIPRDQRTPEQKQSFKQFDVTMRNIKRIIAKVPGGHSFFGGMAAAMFLLKEEGEFTEESYTQYLLEAYQQRIEEEIVNSVGAMGVAFVPDPEDLIIDHETLEDKRDEDDKYGAIWAGLDSIPGYHDSNKYTYANHKLEVQKAVDARRSIISSFLKRHSNIKEDVAVNNIGSGNIAGMKGDGPAKFAGARVFDVDHTKLHKSRFGKHPRHRYAKYLGEDEVANEIRDYSKKNPKESIILKDPTTGGMIYLRRKK